MKKLFLTLLLICSIGTLGISQTDCSKPDETCYRGDRCNYPVQGFYCDGLGSSGVECIVYWAC